MKVHNYAEWNENNKLEITLESPKTESSKFSMTMQISYDQMFCTSDIWVDRPVTVLTSVVKNWCG